MDNSKGYIEQKTYLNNNIILKNEEDDINIKKSKKWNIKLKSNPKEVYSFETQVHNDDIFVINLTNLNDESNHYEIVYNFDDLSKNFQMLPEHYKDNLCTLIDYQVFISGLVKNNKLELYLCKYNNLKLEFTNIAKAPKGVIYSVSILVPKV